MVGLLARRALSLALLVGGLTACAAAAPEGTLATSAPNGAVEQIPIVMARPDGPGPFPAVVILHDCSGLGPGAGGAPGRWSRELVARGYVVLMPDSFPTRGHSGGVCTDASPSRGEVGPARRRIDAYAALAHARSLPFVDGRRVGVMGGSHGGSTTPAGEAGPRGNGGQRGVARPGPARRLRGRGGALPGLPGRARELAERRQRDLPGGGPAPDPDRREGRLDTPGAVRGADAIVAGHAASGGHRGLPGGASLVRQRSAGALRGHSR